MNFYDIFNIGLENKKNRLNFDSEVSCFQQKINENKKNTPSLSAIYRVKNAELYLELSILSIVAICTEIIIIDNNSSDNTLIIAERVKKHLDGICDVKIYSYNNKLSIAGDNYTLNLTEENSLANYYKFCFSKATSDYVMKCDAHLIYTPVALIKIQKKLNKKRRVIIFKGVEIYGYGLSRERYIFKNDNAYTFVDGEFYEELKFDYKLSKIEQLLSTIFIPCFIHIKRIRYINHLGCDNVVEKIYK
ncbi:glycosyltransferase [Photobacterium piscicola]|uniref:glycosyltransferase n=1 Tax=Photobacterium piscicola TaxID=1378299 RepID=UPI002E18A3BB|nr:glycosyltransferase [Photobacterium piscicola]